MICLLPRDKNIKRKNRQSDPCELRGGKNTLADFLAGCRTSSLNQDLSILSLSLSLSNL